MSYRTLGRPKTTSVLDTTGLNAGNWTNHFTHQVLGANVQYFECFKITVTQVPGISDLTVFITNDVWSATQLSGNAEWDPAQPMLLRPEDDVYLCWNIAATGTPIKAQMWLRFDPAINPGA